mgnify:CR=1 FL=1
MDLEERLRDILTVVRGCAEGLKIRNPEERLMIRSLAQAAEDLQGVLDSLTKSDKNIYVSIERNSIFHVV